MIKLLLSGMLIASCLFLTAQEAGMSDIPSIQDENIAKAGHHLVKSRKWFYKSLIYSGISFGAFCIYEKNYPFETRKTKPFNDMLHVVAYASAGIGIGYFVASKILIGRAGVELKGGKVKVALNGEAPGITIACSL